MSLNISRREMLVKGFVSASVLSMFPRNSFGINATENNAEDFFESIEQNNLEAKYIPNDSKSAQVVLTNKTERPLSLKLPASFVGIPILAQFGVAPGNFGGVNNNPFGGGMGRGGNGLNQGGFGGAGVAQTTGGGFGAGGVQNNGLGFGRGGMMGPGGGAFSIPAEEVRVLRVQTVCLEHGKPEPYSRVPYRLEKTEYFSQDPILVFILETLANGKVLQKVAQAAAWHIANNMSWSELENTTVKHLVGPNERIFTTTEIQQAKDFVDYAKKAYESKYRS